MVSLTVRNLDDDVKARLKERARRHGHSLENEVRDILRDAANQPAQPSGGLGTRIAERFKSIGFKKGEIQEFRGYAIKPPDFGE